MKKTVQYLLAAQAVVFLGFGINQYSKELKRMDYGHFSVSLAVKDINASKQFYETLGFAPIEGAGAVEQKWMILSKDDIKIGLFEGMFPDNVLTFNPTNVRGIHKLVEEQGIIIHNPSGLENETGPCSFAIVDPDGNPILFDQFND